LSAFSGGKERGEIEFIFGNGSGSYEGGAPFSNGVLSSEGTSSLYSFQDQGFSNSRTRIVVSKNVAGINEAVRGAVFQEIGLALLEKNSVNYEKEYSSDLVKLYLGNSEDNFISASPKNRVDFGNFAPGLFWKAEFFPGENQEYSPWLNHINYLNYLVEGKGKK